MTEIGLYDYKARIYSPTFGRFMQPDPIGYDDGINFYQYAHSDPLNRKDPTGLTGIDPMDADGGAGDPSDSTDPSDPPDSNNFIGKVQPIVVTAPKPPPPPSYDFSNGNPNAGIPTNGEGGGGAPKPTPPNPESRNPFAHYDPKGHKDVCQIYNMVDGNGGTVINGASAGGAAAMKGTASTVLGRFSVVFTGAQVFFALLDMGFNSAGAGCGQ